MAACKSKEGFVCGDDSLSIQQLKGQYIGSRYCFPTLRATAEAIGAG